MPTKRKERRKGRVVADKLYKQLDRIAMSIAEADRADPPPPGMKRVFTVSRYELGIDPDTKMIIQSLSFGLGGVLSFAMDWSTAQEMLAHLRHTLATEAPPKVLQH